MSNMPSHATSSVNQVASAYSGNPQALQQRTQPQNGVTPELIDLLALQKLQAEKANAARQLALANNQQMPTVADGLEQSAMQSARSEIAQKLGLPDLLKQGQNVAQAGPQGQPQGAPQGQPQMPPQGPTVQAARGGLMRIPSNLPQNYAGGGIIAFGEENSKAQLVENSDDPSTYIDAYTGETISTKPKSSKPFWQTLVKDRSGQLTTANDPRVVDPNEERQAPAPVIPAVAPQTLQQVRNAEKSDSPLPSDPFAASVNLLLQNEGGYKKEDNNGYAVNMGINAKFHPNEDIKGMTRDRAAEIYKNQYWNAIGGDALAAQNPALAAAALDAAANQGVSFTNKALKESGGDINSFLALRKQRYEELAQNNPEQYGKELKGWNNRLDKLASGLNSTAFQATAYSPDQAGQVTRPSGLPAALEAKAAPNPLRTAVEGHTINTLGQTQDQAMNASRELYNKETGASTEAAIAAMRDSIAKRAALQEKEQASRPDKFLGMFNRAGLAALKPASLTPWAGVSDAVEAQRLGYAKQDMDYQTAQDKITQEMHSALRDNDVTRYKSLVDAKKELDVRQSQAGATGERLLATDESTAARLEMKRQGIEAQKQIAADKLEAQRIAQQAKGSLTEKQYADIMDKVYTEVNTQKYLNPQYVEAMKQKDSNAMDAIERQLKNKLIAERVRDTLTAQGTNSAGAVNPTVLRYDATGKPIG